MSLAARGLSVKMSFFDATMPCAVAMLVADLECEESTTILPHADANIMDPILTDQIVAMRQVTARRRLLLLTAPISTPTLG